MTSQEVRAKAVDVTVTHMRKHGFDKVRLSDVAKELGVSHAALYAHFADKTALLDAVTERWLNETDALLEKICLANKDPLQKIQNWFLKAYQIKRERVLRDPELYRAFDVAGALKKPYVVAHLATLNRQLLGLVNEAAGALGGEAPQRQVTLLFEAMSAFHHPKLMAEHFERNRETLLKRVLDAVLTGMSAGPKINISPRR
jgi:AcrR family transcriptional regulator